MKGKGIIQLIASVEMLIGAVTFTSLIVSLILTMSQKPLNIFVFVCASSLISLSIGVGLFSYKEMARKWLIFFSLYIILTKIMIFLEVLHFSGEIIFFLPESLKNFVSIVYHSLIVVVFTRRTVKNCFY